ncbi:MAG: AAA family ATPase [Aliiglaciecola sp.]|uniref:AAA family ATPase n=1 Tax=unclassified Aliiglaciecola TaxID=2593648 RepID=UPI0032973794
MSLVNYSKHFGDKVQGPLKNTFLLSLVTKATQDPPLSEQDREQTYLLVSLSKKHSPSVCGLFGNSELNKSLLLADIAYKSKKKVLFITQQRINQLSPSNLAKLIADIQQHNAIIYFDQADDLISNNITYAHSDEKINLDLLFTVIEKHQGLVIFSLTELENAERLRARHLRVLVTH